MANRLFDRALPEELASCGQHIECKGKIGDFRRLVEIIEAELATITEDKWPRRWRQAPVEIRLDFAWADIEQKLPALTGRVSVQLPTVCQRCLELFELSLDVTLELLLVRADSEPGDLAVSGQYEVWELEEDELLPGVIVEESLVMAIPLAPRHESSDVCGPLAGEVAESGLKAARPFADLRSQMEK
jgi:uncharacterized metal-binding protein YceD (DUF177 family)